MREAKSPVGIDVQLLNHKSSIINVCLTQSSSVRPVDGHPPLADTEVARRAKTARRYMIDLWI